MLPRSARVANGPLPNNPRQAKWKFRADLRQAVALFLLAGTADEAISMANGSMSNVPIAGGAGEWGPLDIPRKQRIRHKPILPLNSLTSRSCGCHGGMIDGTKTEGSCARSSWRSFGRQEKL
jgi:hypothetical protein